MSEFTYRHEINLSEIADEYAKRLEEQVDETALDKAADTLERFGYVKVIRCRDCECMNEFHYRDMLGFGRETIVYRCDYFWNADELPEVEPDGFCAWAVRKEARDD